MPLQSGLKHLIYGLVWIGKCCQDAQCVGFKKEVCMKKKDLLKFLSINTCKDAKWIHKLMIGDFELADLEFS